MSILQYTSDAISDGVIEMPLLILLLTALVAKEIANGVDINASIVANRFLKYAVISLLVMFVGFILLRIIVAQF